MMYVLSEAMKQRKQADPACKAYITEQMNHVSTRAALNARACVAQGVAVGDCVARPTIAAGADESGAQRRQGRGQAGGERPPARPPAPARRAALRPFARVNGGKD
jgi:hypothetical protein